MAKVKQKAARNGAAGASTRGAQAAKQKKHKITVQKDPKDKKLSTVVSNSSRIPFWNAVIDRLPKSVVHKLPAPIVNRLPRKVVYRGLKISRPDSQKVAFTEQPPPGYTFIAAGNPELTTALKEFSNRGNHKIFVVTITPHAKRHELSRQIHRVGYHFPTTIVDQVCAHYGIRLNNKGELIDESKDEDLFRRVYQNAEGKRPAPKEEKDQVTINTEARQTIKDLFPKIPDSDLFRIIKHAFQLKDGRVGTAPELTPLRRAHLAVVAHIRHNYTSYDRLLRQVQYNEARHQVEKETLEKIVEWRGGEDMALEDTSHAANDLLKDVIVISDEEESDGEVNDVQPLHQEQVRVEELPTAANGRGYRRSASPITEEQRDYYQPYPRLVRTYRPSEAEISQRNQTRYAVWNQIRQDYRSRLTQNPSTAPERVYEHEPAQASRILIPLDEPSRPSAPLFRTEAPATRPVRIDYEPLPPRQPTSKDFFRDSNGDYYERVDLPQRTTHVEPLQRYYQHEAPAMSGALVRTRASSPVAQPDLRYQGNFDGGDGTILPSVEGPDGSYLPPRTRRNPFEREANPRETNLARQDGRNHTDPTYIDLTNSSSQTPKRRRLEEVAAPLPGPYVSRRESPGRPVERQYLPQPQARPGPPEFRVLDYGEQRYSPRLQQASALREYPVDRQPHYDAREAPPTVTRVYEPLPVSQEVLESGRVRYRAQNHGAVRQNDVDASHVLPPKYEPLPPASRSYEPMFESRVYDDRIDREHLVPVREQYVQSAMPEARVRYLYADGTDAREPLQPLPSQRVIEYDRSGAQLRSYVR
ncbi:hypothetical protein H2200_013427 [Cladophialophora chaetospira]|uniref:DUF2293 domain-containing protein n=1 Tax=Cladophialophora chaetospira TaxID=386627 RepID=A0AA38WQ07_9EURO|nr:hypothetical protein H2200_013427 [Cladophialophora chaetospira]